MKRKPHFSIASKKWYGPYPYKTLTVVDPEPDSAAGGMEYPTFITGVTLLLLLLIPRFWQRGVAVSYWQQKMLVPVVPRQPTTPFVIAPPRIEPLPVPGAMAPEAAPAVFNTPSELPGP